MQKAAKAQETQRYLIKGRYLADKEWSTFSGEVEVLNGRIIVGNGLHENDGTERKFDLYGIIAKWGERLAIFFIKIYSGNPQACFYYQIGKTKDEGLKGKWEGNWTSQVITEARTCVDQAIIHELLLHSSLTLIPQIEKDLMSDCKSSSRRRNPLLEMRDRMVELTFQRYKKQVSVEITLTPIP